MKKILLSIFIMISLGLTAQDSTKIKGVQLQARLIEALVQQCTNNPDNDSMIQVYIDLRPKFRVQIPPTGSTLVTIDSIPTTGLADLYNFTLGNTEAFGTNAIMKSNIAAARASNTFLDRLCTQYEAFWADRLVQFRKAGRKMLTGK